LHKTPLHALHVALGARMVPFAGYDMPVQYPGGIIAEHTHTRASAGLFDVSHMGQGWLIGPDHATTARALEALVPADMVALQPGQQRYSQLLNDDGGTIDDLMISRSALPGTDGRLYLIVNASRKAVDFAHLRATLPADVTVAERPVWALVALQGPKAAAALERLLPGVSDLAFMTGRSFPLSPGGRASGVYVTRSGYTGEDGFEITVANEDAVGLWTALIDQPEVKPVGLGARDSLRLEAGLCLYGHELDETVSPVEAGLSWSIQKRRRSEGGFPGAARIQRELDHGPSRIRVGIRPEGRAPAREGTEVRSREGRTIGIVTSGGFGPSLGGPVAMGFVDPAFRAPGTDLTLMLRGKPLAAQVVALPFVPNGYKR
jgi:aminomethyltransferase